MHDVISWHVSYPRTIDQTLSYMLLKPKLIDSIRRVSEPTRPFACVQNHSCGLWHARDTAPCEFMEKAKVFPAWRQRNVPAVYLALLKKSTQWPDKVASFWSSDLHDTVLIKLQIFSDPTRDDTKEGAPQIQQKRNDISVAENKTETTRNFCFKSL